MESVVCVYYRFVIAWRERNILAGVLILLSLFFIVPWGRGQVYGTFDLSHITISIEDLYARYQRAGEIPVWVPEVQGGFPMMANGFQSFFYLPHVVLRSSLPGVWVANISLLLHMWLAAAGMWWLLREVPLPTGATAVAALIYAGGGYFIGHVTLPHLFFPAAWLPLILWALLSFWRKPGWRRAAGVAVLAAAQVFAGHVQMFVYTALMMAIVGLVLAARRFDRRLWWAALVPLLVLILTAVHVLPLLELLPLSKRGEAVVGEEAFDVSYPFWQALTWVQADIFGQGETYVGAKNEPELLLFFGVIGTALGFIGGWLAVRQRQPLAVIAGLLIVVGWLLGAGEYSVFYRWLHSLPTFLQGVANPGRAMVLVYLGWSILAGFGANAYLIARGRQGWRIMGGAWLAAGAMAWLLWRALPKGLEAVARQQFEWNLAASLVVAVLVLAWLPGRWRSTVLLGLVAFELLAGGWDVNPRVPAQALVGEPQVAPLLEAREAPRILAHVRFEPVPPSVPALSVGPRLDTVRSIQQTFVAQRAEWRGMRVGLTWNGEQSQEAEVNIKVTDENGEIVREMSIAGEDLRAEEFSEAFFEPLGDSVNRRYTVSIASTAKGAPQPHVLMYATDENDFNPTGELSECVREYCETRPADAALVALYDGETVVPEREALVPIFGEGFGYPMVRGHMQMQLKSVSRYMYELGERADFMPENVLANRTLLDRFSVGWIVGLWPEHRYLEGLLDVRLIGSAPVGDIEGRVYANDAAWPRVHVARAVRSARGADEARQQLVEGNVPSDAVVVVGDVPPEVGGTPADIEVELDEPRQMQIVLSSDSPQLLVVRDIVFPGWRAHINGTPAAILTVDSLFRGVVVPAGEHEVRFSYKPASYRTGAAVSSLGWLAVGVFSVWLSCHRIMALLGKKGAQGRKAVADGSAKR